MDIPNTFKNLTELLTNISNVVVKNQEHVQSLTEEEPNERILKRIDDKMRKTSMKVYYRVAKAVEMLQELKFNCTAIVSQITPLATQQALDEALQQRDDALRSRKQARYERDVAIDALAYFMANKKNMKKEVYYDNTEIVTVLMARKYYEKALKLMSHLDR